MAITDKKTGPWGLDQVYNKINQGSIWEYSSSLKNLFIWGHNNLGQLGQNNLTQYSSPTQIPGSTWRSVVSASYADACAATKTDGTLWNWGADWMGLLGHNADTVHKSSPVQVPGTTWSDKFNIAYQTMSAIKTDSTLWVWGNNVQGGLGQNNLTKYSSPVQIPGTTWDNVSSDLYGNLGIKTDNTLWAWGFNPSGQLGLNDRTARSSPTQIPGTTWRSIHCGVYQTFATKTDGTLWAWGRNGSGQLGQNEAGPSLKSSPTQIPGTTWSTTIQSYSSGCAALKTDGTAWIWGSNSQGSAGQNNTNSGYSSPVQIGSGTDWSDICSSQYSTAGLKTDGTLWAWGRNQAYGQLGLNSAISYSSPVQVPGAWDAIGSRQDGFHGLKLS